MSLLDVLPHPRRFTLGGRSFRVSPLRLRDVAMIESWLSDQVPSPIEAVQANITAMPHGSERDDLLRRTFLAQEVWPPRFGSIEAEPFIESEPGVRFFLLLVLARHQPSIGADDLDAVFSALTSDEYRSLQRFAYGVHPLDELAKLIDGDRPQRPSEPLNWRKCFVGLTGQYPWLDFTRFGDLTIGQFLLLRSGGEHEPAGWKGEEDILEFSRRRLAFFDPPETDIEAPIEHNWTAT